MFFEVIGDKPQPAGGSE